MRLLSILLLLCSTHLAAADTSVWKISLGDRHLYLGGTMHLLSEADYPLPAPFQRAYDASDVLIFEADVAAMAQPYWQQQMRDVILLPAGQQLSDRLQAETWQIVQRQLARIDIPVAAVQPLTPAGFVTTVSVIALRRAGLAAVGVDSHFLMRARYDGKPVLFLEDVQEQLDFLAAMGAGREDALVLSTLEDVVMIDKLLQPMVAAWRSGDMAALDELGAASMREQFPRVYEQLLVSRNHNWLAKIDAMLATDEVEYVLVGALHLAGVDGLLTALGERGYRVQQLP